MTLQLLCWLLCICFEEHRKTRIILKRLGSTETTLKHPALPNEKSAGNLAVVILFTFLGLLPTCSTLIQQDQYHGRTNESPHPKSMGYVFLLLHPSTLANNRRQIPKSTRITTTNHRHCWNTRFGCVYSPASPSNYTVLICMFQGKTTLAAKVVKALNTRHYETQPRNSTTPIAAFVPVRPCAIPQAALLLPVN